MPESVLEVKTFVIKMNCDKCNVGEMVPTGGVYLSYPVQYPHVCNNCFHSSNYTKQYPYTTHSECLPESSYEPKRI